MRLRSEQCSSGSVADRGGRERVLLIRTRIRWPDRLVWLPADATGCRSTKAKYGPCGPRRIPVRDRYSPCICVSAKLKAGAPGRSDLADGGFGALEFPRDPGHRGASRVSAQGAAPASHSVACRTRRQSILGGSARGSDRETVLPSHLWQAGAPCTSETSIRKWRSRVQGWEAVEAEAT
jgi:hypothetical protein